MSDTIDAAAQSSIKVQRVHNLESPMNLAPQVSARDFIRLAQGFYSIFWGLLITVLTGAQLLLLIGVRASTESQAAAVVIMTTELLCALFLAAGTLAILAGSWRLFQVRSLGERWRSRTRVIVALAALLNYFGVCFWLWRRVPENTYLLDNALAFAATGILYLIAFNRVVAALARALGRPDMALESRVLGASNVVLLLLPFVCVVAYLIGMFVIRHTSPFMELRSLLDRVNLLVILLMLLPFSLTLSLAWGCKDALLRQLATFDQKPSQESDPA